jgi:hypothetical protein
LNWGNRHDGRSRQILEINAFKLVGLYVFQAEELQRSLCLHVPEEAEASIQDEYLIAHCIPLQVIVGSQNSNDIERVLLSFQMRDISTDRPTECHNGEQSYSSIIPMIAPHPEDIASKELLDALDTPRICLEEYNSEDGIPEDMVMSVLSAGRNSLILLSQHARNITM